MSHTSRKRKKHRSEYKRREESSKDDYNKPLETALFVVAHEADIVRGPQATVAAQALEVVEYYLPERPPRKKIGSALVKWGGSSLPGFGPGTQKLPAFPGDDDDELNDDQIGNHGQADEDEDDETWVDRYDARLLLDPLPPVQSGPIAPSGRAESPGGWSDLPSDAEDTFFFTPDELEDYHREKRRRTIDQAREERLKARLAEDKEDEGGGEGEGDVWGGSDEEPDDTQQELMRRTAVHLHSSPNSAQLEMRILANHGADKRFAFLRGRWSRTWKLIKYKVRLQASPGETAKESGEVQGGRSLGALADYGDSDEEGTSSQGGT